MTVNDLEAWQIRGSVRSVKNSHARWDAATNSWTESGWSRSALFNPDGRLSKTEDQNRDGSTRDSEWLYDETGRLSEMRSGMRGSAVRRTQYLYDQTGRVSRTVVIEPDGSTVDSERYTYDEFGKKTKTVFLRTRIEEMKNSVSASGAAFHMITYGADPLPSEVCICDVDGKLIRRLTLECNESGRLLKEETSMTGSSLQHFQSGEHQQAVKSAISQIFGETFSSTTYKYDDRGRLVERNTRIGTLQEDRTTYRYDDRDDPVEETMESTSREASLKDEGTLNYTTHASNVQHTRFEYRYDQHGNWTSRIVFIRLEPEPEFQCSNIERREIHYYPS